MNKKIWLIFLGVGVVVAVVAIFLAKPKEATGNYDAFAQCLTEKKVKMWGAYWCSHCENQKKLFGGSFQYVTYVECGIQGNPSGQTQECKDAKIEGYPTWEFSDGSRLSGEQSFETLSGKTGCAIQPTNLNVNN